MGTYNTLSRRRTSNDVLTPQAGAPAGIRWVHASRRQQMPQRPVLGDCQVYITRRGTVFHSAWCQVVQRTWEFNRPTLQVCDQGEVGERRLCRSCAEESRRH